MIHPAITIFAVLAGIGTAYGVGRSHERTHTAMLRLEATAKLHSDLVTAQKLKKGEIDAKSAEAQAIGKEVFDLIAAMPAEVIETTRTVTETRYEERVVPGETKTVTVRVPVCDYDDTVRKRLNAINVR